MKLRQFRFCLILAFAASGFSCASNTAGVPTANNSAVGKMTAAPVAEATPARELDVPYVPTHMDVVDEMLKMAEVSRDDVLYDLGSGDGRIPIEAAKRFGTRGVGIDLNPQRIKEANANARSAGVTEKVRFVEGDIFKSDFREATVVSLYLLPAINLQLKPQLLEQLKPGTRIVSHNYDMGSWQPEKMKKIKTPDGVDHFVYFWRVPEREP